jgi:hypothetical protein
MSLQDWVRNGWLTEHDSSREEIRELLALADRDIGACRTPDLPADWRFAIAYNAALQAATAALAAAGFRASREVHHYRVIQSLALTIGATNELIRSFDAFRKKRNVSSYEIGGMVSDKEADEMATLATELRQNVERWIRDTHPQLIS